MASHTRREGSTFLVQASAFFRHFAAAAFVLGFLLAVPPASARVNVVTLPGRDTVQLTIYNSVDLTLVKETRTLTFRKGVNKLEFSWAGTLIDPTSVEFRPLTHADEVDVLDVSFPPRVTNTLEWRIKSEFAGEVKVEIRYFTSGIKWAADYVAEADKAEKLMKLAGNVRVTNHSGEDYENAQVRLVVGVVRLVEQIVALANRRLAEGDELNDRLAGLKDADSSRLRREAVMEFGMAMDRVEKSKGADKVEVVKEALGEYFLYTVGGRDTIPNGWAKRLPSFAEAGVPLTSYYKFERERWGNQVMRYYQFTNSVPSKLGKEPLPDGSVKAFRVVSADQLYAFVGHTAVKYIPIGEAVEMELGNDLEVLVKPVLMNWTKTDLKFSPQGNVVGWTTKETWEFEVQNSKDIDVVLDIRRNFRGDWTLATAAPYEKVDATKVKFVRPLKAREKQMFSYELTVRHGTNATK
ncbi:MAG: hypothetical protein B9S33_06955 [Pedosphaera sp. Tous-C6FEB]|nr:MAG: hypothetical protein B9S33_06955 [Pedosphaera sp. Tous-C6FEB]